MTSTKKISIKETFKYGFRMWWKHVGMLTIALIITIAAVAGIGYLLNMLVHSIAPGFSLGSAAKGMMMGGGRPGIGAIKGTLVDMIVAMIFSQAMQMVVSFLLSLFVTIFVLGFIRVSLELHDKGSSRVMRLFVGLWMILKGWMIVIVQTLLMALIYALGFGLFFLLTRVGAPMVLAQLTLTIAPLFILFYGIRISFASFFLVDKKAGPIGSMVASYRATCGMFWRLFGLFIVAGFVGGTVILMPAMFLMLTAVYRKIS